MSTEANARVDLPGLQVRDAVGVERDALVVEQRDVLGRRGPARTLLPELRRVDAVTAPRRVDLGKHGSELARGVVGRGGLGRGDVQPGDRRQVDARQHLSDGLGDLLQVGHDVA